jgi:hypothetical protein
VYDPISNKEYHDIKDLTSIGVYVKRKLDQINRIGDIIIIKKKKEEQGCSCSILKNGYNITDIPVKKHLSISYLLR